MPRTLARRPLLAAGLAALAAPALGQGHYPDRPIRVFVPWTPGGAHPTAANFITKRAAYASCADTGTRVRGAGSCEQITGLSLNSFQTLALPGPAAIGGHRTYGVRSRIATVGVPRSRAMP